MSELRPDVRVAFWNCLAWGDNVQKVEYTGALLETYQPEALIITECTEVMADALRDEHDFVDYETSLFANGHRQGMCVVSPEVIDVKRDNPWRAINGVNHFSRFEKQYDDDRQYIRFELEDRRAASLGRIVVYGGHITHPHYLWMPALNVRRTDEWRVFKKLMAEETMPFMWFADTNTFRRHTVQRRLGLNAIGASQLSHDGGPTWFFGTSSKIPRALYLDRGVVSSDISHETSLTTLPHSIDGVVCPSDHRPVLAVVQ